jgi:hypothetical protein
MLRWVSSINPAVATEMRLGMLWTADGGLSWVHDYLGLPQ